MHHVDEHSHIQTEELVEMHADTNESIKATGYIPACTNVDPRCAIFTPKEIPSMLMAGYVRGTSLHAPTDALPHNYT